jgi:N-acetyltransferase 10
MLDYHVILDLLTMITDLYFADRLQISLSGVQRAILLAIGVQRKSIDDIAKELSLLSGQVMAMFIKIVKKVSSTFQEIETVALETDIPDDVHGNGALNDQESFIPLEKNLDDEMEEAGIEVVSTLKEKQQELIKSLDLSKYDYVCSSPS